MNKPANELDIILDILLRSHEAKPSSAFISSLLNQYRERGSLSKKQLEGLHQKASGIKSIPTARLATLEAIILRKPTRYRSTATRTPVQNNDDGTACKVLDILKKFPQHKRVTYFKMKLDKNSPLNIQERNELEKFHKLIM